jgi:hypothetical protein
MDTRECVELPNGIEIRLITAPVFIAKKLEAFAGRGENDFLLSHDLGDLIAVVDGRDSLVAECAVADASLRSYLRDRLASLVQTPAFVDALTGHLPGDRASQDRLPDLEDRLRALSELQ